MMRSKIPTILLVSDGRAETANQVLKAAAVQFQDQEYRCLRRPNVRTPEEVVHIVAEAEKLDAVIFYTLVSNETRQAMRRASGSNVEIVDILGPAFTALKGQFKKKPGAVPGLLYDLDRDRFDRMTAFDYALAYDDGQRLHELHRADVVLVGVSRASKSSTCFYLAYQGIRAANVPLLPDRDPPVQLLKIPRNRVVGLRINVMRLLRVREGRMPGLGRENEKDYVDRRAVANEVNNANRLMEKQKWNTIDVSYLAIEEIAREIMYLCNPRSRRL
jgi:regulator of PEP synthase PpsR (kinase-PPPase family)